MDSPRRIAATAMVALLAIGVIGCTGRNHLLFTADDIQPAPDPHPLPPLASAFAGADETVTVDQRSLEKSKRYELIRLSFRSAGGNGQVDDLVTVDYHRSTLPGRHPVVIVLPIWGRYVYPSNAITRMVRRRSGGEVHVLNVLGEHFLTDWAALEVETDEEAFLSLLREGADHEVNTIVDVRRLLNWADARSEIAGDRIGLIGFSHSAIVAPTIAATDSRIGALVLLMGGAHPHRVIARCSGPRMTVIQDHAAATFGWDADELEARLEPIFAPIDVANYPDRVDPEKVLIFEASQDTCIDEVARDALRRSMRNPETWLLETAHKRAFLAMTPLGFNWMRHRIWDFFERRLLDDGRY